MHLVLYNVLHLIFRIFLLSPFYSGILYNKIIHLYLIVFYASFQVDPFLQLVNDSKLQSVDDTVRQPSKAYGSKEDDEDALKSLSSIKITESQSNESFATMIVQSLGKPANVTTIYLSFNVSLVYQDQCINLHFCVHQESSVLKERLLNNFSPDDACPLGVQLSLDTTGYQSGLKDDKHSDMVNLHSSPHTRFFVKYKYISCILTCTVTYMKLCRLMFHYLLLMMTFQLLVWKAKLVLMHNNSL